MYLKNWKGKKKDMIKKICNQYFFSVEGQTEEMYLKHLQNLINNNEELTYRVKFDIKVSKSVIRRAKRIVGAI